MIKAYRKKPVVIDAVQLTESNSWDIENWTGGECAPLANGELIIFTLEGDMRATKGDWIIRGINGEFYPCKPDIFEMTYEEIIDG